ncbi:MAG: hypothetical protein FWC03_12905 [Treponema sp.]|nr:hypothetical protein [Treponema sp.]
MKNIFKLMGVIALAAVIGFASCDNGTTNNNSQGSGNSSLYSWTDSTNNYELTINNNSQGAVYSSLYSWTDGARTAVTSGSYNLVIISIANPANKKTVSGTATSGSGGQITLSNTGGTPITITITANRTTITIPSGAEIYISASEKIPMASGSKSLGGVDAGDGGINFNDAKWKNQNLYVAVYKNGSYHSEKSYSGSNITSTTVVMTTEDGNAIAVPFYTISSNTDAWKINVVNNKLSVALGNPDKASNTSSPFFPSSISIPADMKIVVINGFSDGSSSNGIYLQDLNSGRQEMVIFAHANKAGVISGSSSFISGYGTEGTLNINLNLKAGWNTLILNSDMTTMTVNIVTGVPGSNYKWSCGEEYIE